MTTGKLLTRPPSFLRRTVESSMFTPSSMNSRISGGSGMLGGGAFLAVAAAASASALLKENDDCRRQHELSNSRYSPHANFDGNLNQLETIYRNTRLTPRSFDRLSPPRYFSTSTLTSIKLPLSTSTKSQYLGSTCQCEASPPPSFASASPLEASSDLGVEPNIDHHHRRRLLLQRRRTLRVLDACATKHRTLSSLYQVNWDQTPLGTGAFGHVLVATNRQSGERVALKRIPKKLASREDFQREMEALLRIQKWGGHPHICALREHFDEGGYYYLILDLIEGGEMFDHLVNHGAYSEADAARLVREVASALNFLHGIGVVHNDIKPENLMLSTVYARDGVIQLVDFGCAEVEGEDDDDDDIEDLASIIGNGSGVSGRKANMGGFTPAYCPPEGFENCDSPPLPPADMWALGVIVYIMLTGVHPFDIQGRATDEEIERDVRNFDSPLPLGPNHPYSRHLSPSAQDLIRRLMNRNPKERLSAFEMLHHPWVTGETASTDVMAGSDARLNKFRKFKTRLQKQFFADVVKWSDEAIVDETRRRTSLIERSFRSFDVSIGGEEVIVPGDKLYTSKRSDEKAMTMSDYHDLLSENMKQKYFPKGHIIYHEGDHGDHMYFINSGTIEVITDDGLKKDRHQGDFFGEGALLHPLKRRSATIKCKTPVHAIEINREYFEKYMASSSGLLISMKEKDKIRKRNRAKAILKLQNDMTSESYLFGQELYKEGEDGDSLYIVEQGRVEVSTGGHQVFIATSGNFCGEHSLLTGKLRNTTATCMSKEGCVATHMLARDFRKLMDAAPHIKESLVDLMIRREFKKAVVLRLGHEFPYLNPRKAFDAVDVKRRGVLTTEDIARLMRGLNINYSDNDVQTMMRALDLNNSGTVTFDEFKKIFIGDIRATQSM